MESIINCLVKLSKNTKLLESYLKATNQNEMYQIMLEINKQAGFNLTSSAHFIKFIDLSSERNIISSNTNPLNDIKTNQKIIGEQLQKTILLIASETMMNVEPPKMAM